MTKEKQTNTAQHIHSYGRIRQEESPAGAAVNGTAPYAHAMAELFL